MIARHQRRQFAVIPPRQILADFDDLRGDQVEIVEEPLRSGRDEGAVPNILSERPIGVGQNAPVVAQARIDVPCVAAARIDREVGRERERALFEPLRAQRFFAKRLIASPTVSRPMME
jgi:hypothetical protein